MFPIPSSLLLASGHKLDWPHKYTRHSWAQVSQLYPERSLCVQWSPCPCFHAALHQNELTGLKLVREGKELHAACFLSLAYIKSLVVWAEQRVIQKSIKRC